MPRKVAKAAKKGGDARTPSKKARRREEKEESEEEETIESDEREEDEDDDDDDASQSSREGPEEATKTTVNYDGNTISLSERIPVVVAGAPLSKRLKAQGFSIAAAENGEAKKTTSTSAVKSSETTDKHNQQSQRKPGDGVMRALPRPLQGVLTPGFRVVTNRRGEGSSRSSDEESEGDEEEEEDDRSEEDESSLSEQNNWSRPANALITEVPTRTLGVTYDADSEDESFIASIKEKCRAAHVKMCTLDELERGFEALERADHGETIKSRLAKEFADLTKRNAMTLAKAEYVLNTLQKVATKALPPVASAAKLNRDAEQYARAKLRPNNGGKSSSSSSSANPTTTIIASASKSKWHPMHGVVARAIGREENDVVVNGIYSHWLARRKEGGNRPMLHFAPNEILREDDSSGEEEGDEQQQVASASMSEAERRRSLADAAAAEREVFARFRYYREDLERVRLLADTMRRREKLKKELIRMELEECQQSNGNRRRSRRDEEEEEESA